MSQPEHVQASTLHNATSSALTQAVSASFATTEPERLRVILQSLVKHLHDFARDVRLTETEWLQGIAFLTRTGDITDAKRQEFVLLSDVLGLSMQVMGVNNQPVAEAGVAALEPTISTEATIFGPFFVEHSPAFQNGDDIANGFSGEPCYIDGRILGADGKPIAGALIEIWQADDQGFYDVQYPDLAEPRGRGHIHSAEDGRFWFWTVRPVAYPIPYDGPVGDLLRVAKRSPMRPAHVHFIIRAEGYTPIITHVFAAGDQYIDTDAVFGVKQSLITAFARHEPGVAPDGTQRSEPFYTASYDFVLAPVS